MKTVFVNDIPYPLKTLPGMPAIGKLNLLPGSIVYHVNGFFGKLYVYHIKAGGVTIDYTVIQVRTGCSIRVAGKRGYRSHILLKNGAVHTAGGTGSVMIHEGQANLYGPELLDWCMETVSGNDYSCLDIFYPQRILAPFINHPQQPFVFDRLVFLSYGQREMIDSLLHCPLPEELRNQFRKIKTQEFLIAMLDALNNNIAVNTGIDPGRWYEIKQFIADHLQEHYTIDILARKFGINTTTLKKEFHRLFGYGLFAFLTRLRMIKALELLQHSSCSIAEIAYSIGYSNTGSFTKAFRKHFGHTPAKTRKPL